MSNITAQSHSEDLFSRTKPGFIYSIGQVPSSKQILQSKEITKDSLIKGHLQKYGQDCDKPTRNGKLPELVRVECCFHLKAWTYKGRHICWDLGRAETIGEIHPAGARACRVGNQPLKNSRQEGSQGTTCPDISSLTPSSLLLMPPNGWTQSEAEGEGSQSVDRTQGSQPHKAQSRAEKAGQWISGKGEEGKENVQQGILLTRFGSQEHIHIAIMNMSILCSDTVIDWGVNQAWWNQTILPFISWSFPLWVSKEKEANPMPLTKAERVSLCAPFPY